MYQELKSLCSQCSLILDPDGAELSKLLEMKGVKRSDQSQHLEQYREKSAGAVPSLPGSPAHTSQPEQSRIAKLEKLIKTRL